MNTQSRHRTGGVLLAVTLVAVLCLTKWGERPTEPPRRTATPIPPAESSSTGSLHETPAATVEEIHVRLGEATSWVGNVVAPSNLDIVAIWPDELAIPDTETTQLVKALALNQSRQRQQDVHEMLIVADSDDIVGDIEAALSSPGRAFLELETARLRSEHTYEHVKRRWVNSHLEEGQDYATSFGEVWRHAPGRPVQDYQKLIALSAAIQDRYPQHLIADFGALYEGVASFPKGMRQGRDTPDVERFFSALQTIEDPVLQQELAARVSRFDRWIEAPTWGLDILEQVDGTTTYAQASTAQWALDSALGRGDWHRAARWATRFGDAVNSICSGEDQSLECSSYRRSNRDASSRLAALGYLEPNTWKQALIAEVWRCHLQSQEGHHGVATGQAHWDGAAWRWDSWDSQGEVAICVMEATPTLPNPPLGTHIRLVIEGAAL